MKRESKEGEAKNSGVFFLTCFTVFSLMLPPAFPQTEGGAKAEQKSLYERLGGEETLRSMAGDFVARVVSDPDVNFGRHGIPSHWQASPANINHLIEDFAAYFGQITGGPYLHEVDLKTIHSGMQITDAEFDAFVADLKVSLNRLNVPAQEQEELMEIVGSTRADIVEAKD